MLAIPVLLCLFATDLKALDPERPVTQYLRTSWMMRNGFPGGQVNGISQTRDGYLWIGTDRGLLRFDGQTFVEGSRIDAALPASIHTLGLVTDYEGSLWITQEAPALLRYRPGHIDRFFTGSKERVVSMNRGAQGELLVAALLDGKLRYSNGQFERLLPANPSTSLALSIAESPGGRVWVGTRDEGLYWVGKDMEQAPGTLPDKKVNAMEPAGDLRLWIGTDNGLALWDGTKTTTENIPEQLQRVQVLSLLLDRDQNLWVGTAHGLLRLGRNNAVSTDPAFTSAVTALYEDREGNIWVGTPLGIDRLRDTAFMTQPLEGARGEGAIYVDADGRAWIAPSSGGLLSLINGKVERVTVPGMDHDVIYSLDGAGNELWLGRQRGGLTHLRVQNGAVISAQTYATADGLPEDSIYAVRRNLDGSVWAATLNKGVSLLRAGHSTTINASNGLPSNAVVAVENTPDATWFATPQGLARYGGDGHWKIYTQRDGLPSDDVASLLADSDGSLWIGTSAGLAVLRSGHIQSLARLHPALHEPILGLAQDKVGSLWVATATRVISFDRKRLTAADFRPREYDASDGLSGTEAIRRTRSVVADSRGRIWFSLSQGLVTIDPGRAFLSAVPSLTHIGSLSADGNPLQLDAPGHLPSGTHRLTFNYDGLSLAMPERVRFRYRLDGFDHDWSDPVSMRQAVYTNLAPGDYRFRVLSSSDGEDWSGQEAAYGFNIAPALWQTWWFQLAMAAGLGLLATLIFHWRMGQMTEKLNLRFEERLAERTRIAQELHDTLLQGFLSASMQLHVAVEKLPPESAVRPSLDHILALMQQVNQEGRNTLRGLRENNTVLSIEQSFSRVLQDLPLAPSSTPHPAFHVFVQGQPRVIHPAIRDEVYRIGREAIVNAFLHAHASSVEVEIAYMPSHLRVSVRDNGSGIDPEILRTGREGHWGIVGMRERARSIGANLKLFSRTEAGTEVELDVPGQIAYPAPPSSSLRSRIAGWLRRRVI